MTKSPRKKSDYVTIAIWNGRYVARYDTFAPDGEPVFRMRLDGTQSTSLPEVRKRAKAEAKRHGVPFMDEVTEDWG